MPHPSAIVLEALEHTALPKKLESQYELDAGCVAVVQN